MGWILDGDKLRSDASLEREAITEALRDSAARCGEEVDPGLVDELIADGITAEEVRTVCEAVAAYQKSRYTQEELQAFEKVMSKVPEEPEKYDIYTIVQDMNDFMHGLGVCVDLQAPAKEEIE